MGPDDVVLPVVQMLQDPASDIGGEEVVIVPHIEPLGVPTSVIRRQSHQDAILRFLRLASLQHQIEAAGTHRLPHPCGSTGGVEELAPVQMEPQILVRYHPEVALTHRCENRHGGDGVRRKMLDLHTVIVVERPHKMARRGAQAVAVELGEGDHVALGRSWFPVIRHRRNPLRPRRGNAGAQEPLPLELQQLALHHRQRAPVVGGDESHQHPEEEGEQLCYCSRVRAREMARRQRQ